MGAKIRVLLNGNPTNIDEHNYHFLSLEVILVIKLTLVLLVRTGEEITICS